MATDESRRAQRLRQRAVTRRMILKKSRSRTPERPDYGRYWLTDHDGVRQHGGDEGLSLDEVERILARLPRRLTVGWRHRLAAAVKVPYGKSSGRRMRSKVSTQRVYELNCEEHGVLDASSNYSVIKVSRESHRRESPECFKSTQQK